ncbi:hypothetical protein GCM10009839_66280 [Catenulispora yoronensis]|uniref:DUF2199 domain-containing protein n=1 Tax=Catenulispora yoronensis TaxID=450799 RepID=A0ABN2V4I0_9ACTN
MAVFATYCQVCGLPVQQDHYVPAEDGAYFHIWRGDGEDACDPLVAFGPEHAWLREAIGLRIDEDALLMPTVSGVVHDGDLESPGGRLFNADLFDGEGDERMALHGACWRLADEPTSWDALAQVRELRELPEGENHYRQQLFDFGPFVEDGLGWMLADPESATPEGLRSRGRILELLQISDPSD